MNDDKPILLVEDNPDDIDLTLLAFRENRILNPVVVKRNGAEALEYLFCTGAHPGQAAAELPALVLLDLKLPKIDGHEVLRQVREHERTKLLPIVVLTSSKEERDLIRSYELGTNSYVRKPVDFSAFREVARQLSQYWLILNEPPPKAL